MDMYFSLFRDRRKRRLLEKIDEMAKFYLDKYEEYDRDALERKELAIKIYEEYKRTGDQEYLRRASMLYESSKELKKKSTAFLKLYLMMDRVRRVAEVAESTKVLNEIESLVTDIGKRKIDLEYKYIDRIIEEVSSRIENIVEAGEKGSIARELEEEIKRREEGVMEKEVIERIEELEKELETLRRKKKVKEEIKE